MNSIKNLVIVSTLCLLSSSLLSAKVIFQDDFSGSAMTDLNGSPLDVTVAGQTWRANSHFKANGSLVTSRRHASAFLDYTLTEGHVYTLSADLTVVGEDWIAFGFVRNTENLRDRHSDASQGIAWGIHRNFDGDNPNQQIFGGPRTKNLVYSSELKAETIKYQLILDTTDANNVLFSASINDDLVVTGESLGSLLKLDVAGLGFTSRSGAVGSIGNFSFSSVPE
ncbi:hypothetical protein ACWPKO_03165 [Coraliomargarita sp. W4R53]